MGLIAVNKNLNQVKEWVKERMGKDQKIGNAVGKLRQFIIEPFIAHKDVSRTSHDTHSTEHTMLINQNSNFYVG